MLVARCMMLQGCPRHLSMTCAQLWGRSTRPPWPHWPTRSAAQHIPLPTSFATRRRPSSSQRWAPSWRAYTREPAEPAGTARPPKPRRRHTLDLAPVLERMRAAVPAAHFNFSEVRPSRHDHLPSSDRGTARPLQQSNSPGTRRWNGGAHCPLTDTLGQANAVPPQRAPPESHN